MLDIIIIEVHCIFDQELNGLKEILDGMALNYGYDSRYQDAGI